jgi:hypothetical protein
MAEQPQLKKEWHAEHAYGVLNMLLSVQYSYSEVHAVAAAGQQLLAPYLLHYNQFVANCTQ